MPDGMQELELAAAPLLEAALAGSGADAIHLYRVGRPGGDQEVLELVSARGLPATFEWGVSIPLSTDGRVAGVLMAARLNGNAFTLQQETLLRALQLPLESLLENARLKAELQRANERLAGRKNIERAKGIIQNRHGWTEEEAYLHLRRLSRKTRKPMGEIARSFITKTT